MEILEKQDEFLGTYGFLIENTAKLIKKKLQNRFKENGFNITVDQWIVLHQLSNANGLIQNELSELAKKDAPTVTRIIDLLCKKHLAVRRSDRYDRRKFKIFLTEDGEQLITQVLPIVLEVRKEGWRNLNEKDYFELVRILDTINHNFTDPE